jgi:hypothetical protein
VLVGLPGLAKTKLVDTMGTVLGLDARRIPNSTTTSTIPTSMPSAASCLFDTTGCGLNGFRRWIVCAMIAHRCTPPARLAAGLDAPFLASQAKRQRGAVMAADPSTWKRIRGGARAWR